MKKNSLSEYWLGINYKRNYDPLTGKNKKTELGLNLLNLVGYQKAISNFVRIVTNQDIPVNFSSGYNSYTDGKEVVLSTKIKDENFDTTVGLALHEGSHIKLTDFKHLHQGIENFIPSNLYDLGSKKGFEKSEINDYVTQLLNIIEDRRIDKFIQDEAPGYKGYYQAMYDEYFNSKMIDKALISKMWNQPTVEHYINHIMNFINVNRTLDLLPGLSDIWEEINLKDISRLKSTDDSLSVALNSFEILLNNLKDQTKEQRQEQDKQSGDGESGDKQSEDKQSGDGNKQSEDKESGDGNKNPNLDQPNNSGKEFSEKQLKQIKEALKKQKEFTKGQVKKTKLSSKQKKQIKSIISSDAEVKNVDLSSEGGYGTEEVVVIKKISEDSKGICSMFRSSINGSSESAVTSGFIMGKALGKKLKIRNDEVTTTYNRQRKGKIDRRLLADLGIGNTKIFEQTFITSSNDCGIHISIDASGSMGGTRWKNALKAATAIAVAANLVGGIRVRIDIRSYCSTAGLTNSSNPAVVLIAYDSKKNSINHIRKYFKHLRPAGGTPEGICFKAIQDIIQQGNNGMDKYFINMSDGAPCNGAIKPTTNSIKKMKANGLNVLSYLIDGAEDSNCGRIFKEMYGDSSEYVNVSNVMDVAKTLNKLLSKRG